MNEETAFIGGHACSAGLKRNMRMLFQTSHAPDVVAAIESEIGALLRERDGLHETILMQSRALDDANENAAYYKDRTETPAILKRTMWITGLSGFVLGMAGWGLLRMAL